MYVRVPLGLSWRMMKERAQVCITILFSHIADLQIRGSIEDISNNNFSYSSKKTYVVKPSLELSRRNGSNDGSQHMFQRSNMENYS